MQRPYGIKNDSPFGEHKSQAVARNKTAPEPIYVNRIESAAVNYMNKSTIPHEYNNWNENGDRVQYNASKLRSNYKLMGKPPSGEKHLKGFHGLSLDEREMPITRERSKLMQSSSSKRFAGDTKKTIKSAESPKLLRVSTCDIYPSRGRNR